MAGYNILHKQVKKDFFYVLNIDMNKGRPGIGLGKETTDRKLGQAYSLPGNRDISNTTSNWIRPLPSPQGAEPV